MTDQQIQRNVVAVIGTGGMGVAVARRFAAGRHLILADYSDKLQNQPVELRVSFTRLV
jgi:3-hydroxyacyl-CoA dehydrogenase